MAPVLEAPTPGRGLLHIYSLDVNVRTDRKSCRPTKRSTSCDVIKSQMLNLSVRSLTVLVILMSKIFGPRLCVAGSVFKCRALARLLLIAPPAPLLRWGKQSLTLTKGWSLKNLSLKPVSVSKSRVANALAANWNSPDNGP